MLPLRPGHLITVLLAEHDAARFELFLYQTGPAGLPQVRALLLMPLLLLAVAATGWSKPIQYQHADATPGCCIAAAGQELGGGVPSPIKSKTLSMAKEDHVDNHILLRIPHSGAKRK